MFQDLVAEQAGLRIWAGKQLSYVECMKGDLMPGARALTAQSVTLSK